MITGSCTLGLPYGDHPRQRVDVFLPADARGLPLACLIPGGWWADGRSDGLRLAALALAERGLPVATLGHRPLGDGARNGSEILADLQAAAAKALEEAGVLGFAGRSLALVGSGAGSLCALILAVRSQITVRAAVACGVTGSLEPNGGHAASLQSACDRFAGGSHRDLSPVHLDPSALPPVLLLHGDADREVPSALALQAHIGEGSRLAILSGAGHQFIEDAASALGRNALEQVAAFVSEQGCEPEDQRIFAGKLC